MLRRGEAELTGNRGNRGRGVLQIALGPFNAAGKDKGVRRDACEPFEPLQKACLRKRGAPRQLIDRIILPRIRAYLLHNPLYTRHGQDSPRQFRCLDKGDKKRKRRIADKAPP